MLKRDEIEGFGVRALMTDYRSPPGGLPTADHMEGMIVTVVHGEFRWMGLEDLRRVASERVRWWSI